MTISKPAQLQALKLSPRDWTSMIAAKLSVDIASEAAFMRILRLEVRRSERSGRPFMLVLVSGDPFGGETGPKFASDIAADINSSIRETDCLGWYEQDLTLGILLTEVGDADDAKVELVAQRISRAIRMAVSQEQYHHLRLVVRLFPEASNNENDSAWKEAFYRSLFHQQDSGPQESTLKRTIDVSGSLLGLLLLLPVFAAIAILIKVTSRGPVLFWQKRVGQFGQLFTFYKFRSMYADSDSGVHRDYVTKLIEGAQHVQQPNGMYKLVHDTRVTPLGRILRKWSLDELPQFINVLAGDMSLVGPRPPLPYEFDRYRTWHKRRVLETKPGLTGLWQVKGRSRTTFDEMVRMDLRYAKSRSLLKDLRIILQTPGAMFTGSGAF